MGDEQALWKWMTKIVRRIYLIMCAAEQRALGRIRFLFRVGRASYRRSYS